MIIFVKIAYAEHWATHGGILVIPPTPLKENQSLIEKLNKIKVYPYKQVYRQPANNTVGSNSSTKTSVVMSPQVGGKMLVIIGYN